MNKQVARRTPAAPPLGVHVFTVRLFNNRNNTFKDSKHFVQDIPGTSFTQRVEMRYYEVKRGYENNGYTEGVDFIIIPASAFS